MKLDVRPWGSTADGSRVYLYIMENEGGLKVTVSDYGGTVTSVLAPDRDGMRGDVVLGFDTFEEYMASKTYLGCIVGRYANRIAGARFKIDGVEHSVTRNHGAHHLHGGREASTRSSGRRTRPSTPTRPGWSSATAAWTARRATPGTSTLG